MERRQTRQRQLVLNAVHTLKHPTADEVYAAVADAQPPVGRATVYRNLNLLAEQGEIRRIETGEADRFAPIVKIKTEVVEQWLKN